MYSGKKCYYMFGKGMRYVKNRIYRILEIIILLSNKHKKWKVTELADHFAVTPRTIYRDFEIMDELRIPIYESNHTYSILEDYYFQPPDMTTEEALALLLIGQAFSEEIFPYQENLKTAISKIINSLPKSVQKVVNDIGAKIVYQHGAFVNLNNFKVVIQEIEDAIKKYKSIKIIYYSLSRDSVSERIIDPYKIAYKNGACYLIGNCHNRQDTRMFRIDRIKDLLGTSEFFEEPENFDIDEYLKNSWSVERSEKEKRVVLHFEGKAAKLVREKKWHPSQEIINLPADKIRFRVTTSSMEEIKNWILGYGASVQVIRPKELKQEIVEEINKMQETYQ